MEVNKKSKLCNKTNLQYIFLLFKWINNDSNKFNHTKIMGYCKEFCK